MKKILLLLVLGVAVGLFLSKINSVAKTNISKENIKESLAYDFSLNSINGDTVKLSDLKGKKVLIDFFATWCPPCIEELKGINALIKEYPQEKNNYQILCISVDNSIDTVKSFIKDQGYEMKVLFDDQNIASKYGVMGIPALFLIDENGQISWSQAGYADHSVLKEKLGL